MSVQYLFNVCLLPRMQTALLIVMFLFLCAVHFLSMDLFFTNLPHAARQALPPKFNFVLAR